MIIDVRERDEIQKEGRLESALNIPLSELENSLKALGDLAKNNEIELLCRSGQRAKIAKEKIVNAHDGEINLKVLEGGIQNIPKDQLIFGQSKTSLSIMRQVMIVAGLMIAFLSVVSLFANSLFSWATFAIGSALFLAGLSGICPMAIILGKMPWNK
ncbi:MAG: rhodanese-like domain-containing protein [Lentisphaeraceae bacterium]|nr:rhodanese-like domain-containing protein [Lentisphaeraceae bacterium]